MFKWGYPLFMNSFILGMSQVLAFAERDVYFV
jgi:hypothetical protein